MDSKEICIWLDKRWYAALSRHLDGGTVEDQLNRYLKELISQLPKEEYEPISREIQEEDLRQQQEIEAAKKYSAFHVRERGQEEYFQLERPLGILKAAHFLREYLREDKQDSFADFFGIRQQITVEEYDRLTGRHMEDPQKVTGVFALDFDKKEFSSVDAADGWRTYPMKDVSTAVYHAFRQQSGVSTEHRMSRLLRKLAGKEIASAGHLSARQVSLADTIGEVDGRLNFYLETNFDVDAVFGTHVCTDENDDSLNVYAEYDMAADQVCDQLEVDLHRADGREESVPYTLNAAEKAVLLREMDLYCQAQTGMTLREYSAMRMAEDMEDDRPISVFRITQDGRTDCLLTEGDGAMDALHTALRLRAYLTGHPSERFADAIPAADAIAPEVFQECAEEVRQGAGRVIAALNIDLDRNAFSTMAETYGWQTYCIGYALSAAWDASGPDGMKWEDRKDLFEEYLAGRPSDEEFTDVTPPTGLTM